MTDPAAASAAQSWLDTPGHREWLRARFGDVLAFALPSILPGGGFAYQDADGSPMPGRPPQLFLTARMAYASSIGVRHGIPGSGADRGQPVRLHHRRREQPGAHRNRV